MQLKYKRTTNIETQKLPTFYIQSFDFKLSVCLAELSDYNRYVIKSSTAKLSMMDDNSRDSTNFFFQITKDFWYLKIDRPLFLVNIRENVSISG